MEWDEKYKTIVKKKIVDLAQRIVTGQVEILLGCREIVAPINELLSKGYDENKELLNFFKGVDSESDDLPLGAERKRWNEDALKEKDKIRDKYSSDIKNEVIKNCQELIALFSKDLS